MEETYRMRSGAKCKASVVLRKLLLSQHQSVTILKAYCKPGKLTEAWSPQVLLRFHFVGIIDWIIVDMIQFPVFLLLSLMLDWNHVVQNPKPLIIWVVFLAWTFWVLSQLSCLSCQGHSCNSSYSHKQPGVVWGAHYKKQRYLSLGKSQEFNISGTKTKVSQILYYTGSSLWTISVINSKSWHH